MNLIKTPGGAKDGFQLTPSEMQLIRDFRRLTLDQKNLYAGAIGDASSERRDKQKRPALRLIAQGAP